MVTIDNAIKTLKSQLEKLEAMKAEQEAATGRALLLDKAGCTVAQVVSDKVGSDLIEIRDKAGKLLHAEYVENPNAKGTQGNPYSYEDAMDGIVPAINNAWYVTTEGMLYVCMGGEYVEM